MSGGVRARVATLLALTGAVAAQDLAPKDWDERDLEGKWVAYRRDMDLRGAHDSDRRIKWVRWLGQRGELDLLEWIGVYEGWSAAGTELLRLDAPGWMRVALWSIASSDSHDTDNARKAMLGQAARVLGWAERYPIAQRGADVEPLFAQLRAATLSEAEERQLPPLDDAAVLLAYLDAPPALAEFGAATRAQPGVRYVHQVVRALRGVERRAARIAPHVDKITNLLRHGNATVVAEASAALARLPAHLVPHVRLLAIARGDGDATLRRLATLALSYSSHPGAFLAVHEIALEAAHPGRAAALDRLREIGDEFTLRVFAPPRQEPAPGLFDAIAGRLEDYDGDMRRMALQVAFDRAAWAETAAHPLAASAALDVRARAPQVGVEAVRALQVTVDPGRWDAGPERAAVETAMQRLRAALRDGKR